MSDPRTVQCTRPYSAYFCMYLKPTNQSNNQNTPVYEIPAALEALKAQTHQLITDVRLNHQGRPNGDFMIHCYPIESIVKEIAPELKKIKAHAIIHVSRVYKSITSYNIVVKINPSVRANLQGQVVQSHLRGIEIKKQAKKKKKHDVHDVEPIPPPIIPKDVPPFILKCVVNRHVYSRIYFLLNIKGHRILFLEPPSVPYLNRWLEWEARLIFPNYYIPNNPYQPPHSSEIDSTSAPVEGVHYKLLMSHSDSSRSCFCGPCFGANGGNGKCNIEFDLIHHLIELESPCGISDFPDQAVDVDQYTADELTLSILALVPAINTSLWARKYFLLVTVPTTLLIVISILIRVILQWVD